MTHYPNLLIRKSENHYDWYEVIRDCRFRDIVVKKGFETDFASVPQVVWSIIPPHGRAAVPSVFHDWLYQRQHTHSYSRREADALWLAMMLERKVPTLQAYTMYYFVRWFGHGVWKKYAQKKSE